MKIQKVDKSSSAGTKAEQSSNVDVNPVSQPIAKLGVGGSFGITDAHLYNIENDDTLAINIDFALTLNRKDVFWIREDSVPEDYPWSPTITQEQIDKWSDGWYGILQKSYCPNGELELKVLEVHSKDGGFGNWYKKPFSDMGYDG